MSKSQAGGGAQPVVRIPVADLGYTPPGTIPAFYFHALVNLFFIDENRLLFTFNIQQLMRRDQGCAVPDSQPRMVRAAVLDLPSGKVERKSDWELYDQNDFLWPLAGGQFLLRRCARLDLLGDSLEPHPLIDVAGAVKSVGFSPDRSVAVIEEANDAAPAKKPAQPAAQAKPAPQIDVEFVQLHPLAILARSRIPVPGDVPIVAQGLLEALPGPHHHGVIEMQPFQGPQRQVVGIESFCEPSIATLTEDVFVATVCPRSDAMEYQGYNLNGALLWRIPFTTDRFLPRFLLTRDGAHFAIETLHLTHPHAALDPLTSEGVDAQVIDMYDTRTGVPIGSLRITPVYTAGNNAAFSPDGTRMVVLRNGAIEIYRLSDLAQKGR